jgi:hypothetical protein
VKKIGRKFGNFFTKNSPAPPAAPEQTPVHNLDIAGAGGPEFSASQLTSQSPVQTALREPRPGSVKPRLITEKKLPPLNPEDFKDTWVIAQSYTIPTHTVGTAGEKIFRRYYFYIPLHEEQKIEPPGFMFPVTEGYSGPSGPTVPDKAVFVRAPWGKDYCLRHNPEMQLTDEEHANMLAVFHYYEESGLILKPGEDEIELPSRAQTLQTTRTEDIAGPSSLTLPTLNTDMTSYIANNRSALTALFVLGNNDAAYKFLGRIDLTAKAIFKQPIMKRKSSNQPALKEIKVSLPFALLLSLAFDKAFGHEVFNLGLTSAPAPVLLEACAYCRGALIGKQEAEKIAAGVIQQITMQGGALQGRESSMCDAVTRMLALTFSNYGDQNDGSTDEKLKLFIIHLAKLDPETQLTDAQRIRHVAFVSGFVVAGILRYIITAQEKSARRRHRVLTIIGVTTSALGFAPVPAIAPAGATISSLAGALIDHFWVNPKKSLRKAVNDFVNQEILWPLVNGSNPSGFGLETFPGRNIGEFKVLFDLILSSSSITGL